MVQARFEAEKHRDALQRQVVAAECALQVSQARLEDATADAQVWLAVRQPGFPLHRA